MFPLPKETTMKTEWLGSENPTIQKGTATFDFGDTVIELRFAHFTEFSKVCKLLELVREEQKENDKQQLTILLEGIIKENLR